MLHVSRKMVVTIEALLDIAYNSGDVPVRVGDITQRQGIPKRYLEQVLQDLVRVGILEGVRGPKGGYRLARERRRITLGELARVVQAFEDTGDPLEGINGSILGNMVIRPLWAELRRDVAKRLDAITLEDLCTRARAAGVPSDMQQKADFSI